MGIIKSNLILAEISIVMSTWFKLLCFIQFPDSLNKSKERQDILAFFHLLRQWSWQKLKQCKTIENTNVPIKLQGSKVIMTEGIKTMEKHWNTDIQIKQQGSNFRRL